VSDDDILGQRLISPVALILGTGFCDFLSPMGIVGQCRVEGDNLDLLTLLAPEPGKGHFRKFLASCMQRYSRVRVLHIRNNRLYDFLERTGFHFEKWKYRGEKITGMVWNRPAPEPA
jgi:hypothetical protein